MRNCLLKFYSVHFLLIFVIKVRFAMNTRIKIVLVLSVISLTAYFFISSNSTPDLSSQNISPPKLLVDENAQLQSEMAILTIPIEQTEAPELDTTKPETITTQSDIQFYGIAKQSTEAKDILLEAGVLPSDLAEEAYLEFDLDTLRSLEVGDTFDIEIPQTLETFSTEVTQTQGFPNGDKSVFGRLVGSDGEFHNSVMTVGEDALYGQITTPSGNYVFETKGKHGWLAAKRDLYKSHVEFEPVREVQNGQGGIVLAEPHNN